MTAKKNKPDINRGEGGRVEDLNGGLEQWLKKRKQTKKRIRNRRGQNRHTDAKRKEVQGRVKSEKQYENRGGKKETRGKHIVGEDFGGGAIFFNKRPPGLLSTKKIHQWKKKKMQKGKGQGF